VSDGWDRSEFCPEQNLRVVKINAERLLNKEESPGFENGVGRLEMVLANSATVMNSGSAAHPTCSAPPR
jgi:hypothetical protein